MLRLNEIRKLADRSGARDISKVEIDVILTYLLQLFSEKGLMEHLAFKGGTLLRKMVFGPIGRLSTDLDFTRRTSIALDDLVLEFMGAFEHEYRGLSFDIHNDNGWYVSEDGGGINPVCRYPDNTRGIKIKIQVSTRESPILAIHALPQLSHDYFKQLDFAPSTIPSLALEEVIAEKIRAAHQRSKIRDLHDLAQIAERPFDRARVRGLATLKLWASQGAGIDYSRLCSRIDGEGDYDLNDLVNLLRKDQRPALPVLIQRVKAGYRFLADLSVEERALAQDPDRKLQNEADALRATLLNSAET
jgi:predicted nucleotidyltransferase component of viral defense system